MSEAIPYLREAPRECLRECLVVAGPFAEYIEAFVRLGGVFDECLCVVRAEVPGGYVEADLAGASVWWVNGSSRTSEPLDHEALAKALIAVERARGLA